MEKSPAVLFEERKKRIHDAIALKVPDRVPINAQSGFFAARYSGFTFKDMMYDPQKTREASLRFLNDFQPDLGSNPFLYAFMGAQLESIGYKNLTWPGHGLDEMTSFQFLEKELMSADEYDEYMYDPTDFVIRKIWPRVFAHLKPLEKLPPLQTVVDYIGINTFSAFADEEVQQAFAAMAATGRHVLKMFGLAMEFEKELTQMGYPGLMGSGALAPFDFISDLLRGTRGAMMDMIRHPDKLLAMIDKIYPAMHRLAMGAKQTGQPGVFMPLHKCLDTFMSPDQFKTFYWPTLKKLILECIAEDLIPVVLWEGNCGSRLELIGDIPPGKAIYMIENTDIFKAKEVLGDVVCLQGNVPLSMLITGTPDDVKAHCRKLIEVVGKDGGYILGPSTALDNARAENVKAMFDAVKEYGVYN